MTAGCSATPPPQQEPAQNEEIVAPVQQPEPQRETEPPIKKTEPPVKKDEPAAKPQPPVPVKKETPAAKPQPPAPVKKETPAVKPQPPAPVKKETPAVKPQPLAPVKKEAPAAEAKTEVIAEFEGVTITKETYVQTKTEIEKVVDKLNLITAAKDYSQWITFLSDDYKRQYSQPLTLKKVSEALPVKGIKLNSLRDYFIYVFVPSRQNVKVDDIRFVSPTHVDVIMKQGNRSLLIYGIENTSGNWKLIPPKL